MGSRVKDRLARQSNRAVFVVMLCADVVVFGAGIPLERYSLLAAADASSTALLILALLVANFMLFGVVLLAIATTSLLVNRAVKQFVHRPVKVIRGEVESASIYGSESRQ